MKHEKILKVCAANEEKCGKQEIRRFLQPPLLE